MFRSIRWRLVASYTLMTILAVTLVGVLALFLIERYLLNQERDYLTTNATAVAQQLETVWREPPSPLLLQDLAHTAAFLGDVQVRILDAEERLLVDSGTPANLSEITWFTPANEGSSDSVTYTAAVAAPGFFVKVLPDQQGGAFPAKAGDESALWEKGVRAQSGSIVIMRRDPTIWGDPAYWVDPATGDKAPVAGRSAPAAATTIDKFMPPPHLREQRASVITATGLEQNAISAQRIDQPVVHAIVADGNLVGYVELSKGPDFGAAALLAIRRAFLWAGLGVSLVAMLVALWMSRTLTAPLQDLMQATSGMSGGLLSVRASVRTDDEIGALARQFNTMAAKLEGSFAELAAERDTLRRFVADASHELRTPITALKTFGELLQGPAGAEPATRTEFLQESQKQLHRLEWITSALLKLSRLDAGLLDLPSEALDGCDLVRAAARPFTERAQEKGITFVTLCTDEPTLVWGNRQYLEVALVNLLDNAFKFTQSGGEVRIGIAHQAQAVALWVQDNGIGIAAQDRPYIFDRFYRGLHNTLPATAEGSGLGLAIVQSIVKAHSGRISVKSEAGQGSHFAIWLHSGVGTK